MRPVSRNPLTIILIILLAILGLSSGAIGAVITLEWDSNPPEDNVTGYIVYYGTASDEYTWKKDAGNTTTYDLSGLTPGKNYFIALTAYNKYFNESDFSNEVFGTGRLVPPVITSFNIQSGASNTVSRTVNLNNTVVNNPSYYSPTHYMASESPSFVGATWQTYSSAPKFTVSAGAGTKTIYFKVKNMDGESSVVIDTIALAPAVTSFKINSGTTSTAVQTVTLNNVATNSPTHYMASEASDFGEASWQTYSTAPKLTLSTGAGPKTVYFKVMGGNIESEPVHATISALAPEVASFKIAAGALSTANGSATLNNTAKNSPTHYMASELSDFTGAIWEKYSTAPSFALGSGNGQKKIYFKVKNVFAESPPPSAEDAIDSLVPEVTSFKINAGALSTAKGTVTLNNTAKNNPTHYMASEDSDFVGANWQIYSTAPKFTLSEGGGPKTVHFRTKNMFGESEAKNYTISALLPEVKSVKINAGAVSTANGTVTLNNVATNSPTHYMASESEIFSGADWQVYSTAPKFALSDGGVSKTVYFKVRNSFGVSPAMSDEISTAGLPPVVTSFKINAGALSTGNGTVTLNNTTTNLPMYYMASEDSGFGGADWQPYSAAPKFTVSLGIETKIIHFKTKNIFGESEEMVDTIDAVVPEVTSFNLNSGVATTGKQSITLNNTVKNSPTHYMASEDSGFAGADWQPYSTAPKFTLSSGAGFKMVYFKTKNIFGESYAASSDVIEGLLPEVTSFKINAGAATTANGTVTLSNAAKNSPTHYMASEDSGFVGAEWKAYSTAPKFALSDSSGEKTVYFKVKNSFGESPPPAKSDTISTAGLAPVVTSFKINAGASSTGNGTVTLNNTTTNLPMYYMASEDSGFGGADWQPYSAAPKFTLSLSSGTKTIYFKTHNIFGDSEVRSDTIEALVPEVTSFKINAGASNTGNGKVTLNNTIKNSPTHYIASESDTFGGADWQVYSTAPKFTLSDGAGPKTIYFKTKNIFGGSSVKNDTIEASGLPPVVTSLSINGGASSTTKETVTLGNVAAYSPMEYMASESPTFDGASWQPYSTVLKFTLSAGSATKTVYFKLRNIFGESYVVSDTIGLIQ